MLVTGKPVVARHEPAAIAGEVRRASKRPIPSDGRAQARHLARGGHLADGHGRPGRRQGDAGTLGQGRPVPAFDAE